MDEKRNSVAAARNSGTYVRFRPYDILSTRNRLYTSMLELLHRARRFRSGEITMPGRISSTNVRVDPYPRISSFDSVPIRRASPQLISPDMQIGPYAVPSGSPFVCHEWQGYSYSVNHIVVSQFRTAAVGSTSQTAALYGGTVRIVRVY
jgi:hypothetical protein